MITGKLKIDSEKMACGIIEKIENNIEDSEIFEQLTHEQKIELNGLLYMSIYSVCEDFSELDLVSR